MFQSDGHIFQGHIFSVMANDDYGMSEAEYQETFFDLEIERPGVDEWATRDGRVIPIVHMSDSHLLNTIRFLRRNVFTYQLVIMRRMSNYIMGAPEHAADACEAEAVRLMDMTDDEFLIYRFPQFRNLISEAAKRKLSI